MEYFMMKQDDRYTRTPTIENLNEVIKRKEITIENYKKLKDKYVIYAPSQEEQEYIDILDKQLFLISEEIKKVFEIYNKYMKFVSFYMINETIKDFKRYYTPMLHEIKCVIETKEREENNKKKPILIEKEIKKLSIFKIKDRYAEEQVIIRLDVAESLMRRKIRGMQLIRIEVE